MVSDRILAKLIRSRRGVALYGDLIRAVVAVLAAVAIATAITYQIAMVRFMYSTLHMNDFGKFYYSARLFLEGGDMYAPTPATEIPVGEHETRQFWNMNPPHFHLLLLPLATMTPAGALSVWGSASLLALALSLAVITRETGLRWTLPRIIWAVLLTAANAATGAIVVTGQLSFLLMLGITLAWQAARHDRWTTAAIWLGLLASVKPFLGVFGIYLLARRMWRPTAVMASTGALAAAVGVFVFGWPNYASWIAAVRSASWAWPPMNGSIAGLVSRTFAPSPLFTPIVNAPEAVAVLTAILATAVGIATLRAIAQSPGHTDWAFLLILVATLLVTPLGWIYYLWLPLGPAVACWTSNVRWTAATRAMAVVVVAGLACPLVLTGIWRDAPWASPTIGSAYFWTVFGVWLLAIRPSGLFSAPSLWAGTRAIGEDGTA